MSILMVLNMSLYTGNQRQFVTAYRPPGGLLGQRDYNVYSEVSGLAMANNLPSTGAFFQRPVERAKAVTRQQLMSTYNLHIQAMPMRYGNV